MDMRRVRANAAGEKAWYCLEFYDETQGYHGFSASFTTEDDGLNVLRQADHIAPPTTHIYYWKQDHKPLNEPPDGYREGPLAKPRG